MPDMPKMFRPAQLPSRHEQRRAFDQRRDDNEQRKWYKTARWQKLKLRVHARDLYTCRATGVLCSGKHPEPNSPVADHIIEPDGDPVLFWDEQNIRTVSKEFHDSERQREQIAARGRGVGRKSGTSAG